VALAGYDQPVGTIRRAALGIGYKVDGPALITEDSATLWLAENWQASVDAVGNLILTRLQD
jgi:N-methylhydantoinase A